MWEHVVRPLPGQHFDIHEFLAEGPPWNTKAADGGTVSGNLPGNTRSENALFQRLSLRWGHDTSVETLDDLHVLCAALRQMGEAGVFEAAASPITDHREK